MFIKEYSYKASAIATLGAYSIRMRLCCYVGRKYYPIPYNLKKIGFYMVTSIGLALLSFYRYRGEYFIGIAMLIVFLGLVILLEKKQLKQVLKN